MYIMFRELPEEDIERFETYARENDPDLAKWDLYHPVCRRVWLERGFRPEVER